MYEDLIKSLRICGNHDCTKECYLAGKVDGSDCYAELNRRAADAIEDLIQKAERFETIASATILERDEYLRQSRHLAEAFTNTLGMVHAWITVEERLPKDDEVVLVFGGRSIYTAYYGKNRWGGIGWYKLNSKYHNCNPTHWMPLPEPPKEVSDGTE